MKIKCPKFVPDKDGDCAQPNNVCTLLTDDYPDVGCHREATAKDLIAALKELKPDCSKCQHHGQADIMCQFCVFWGLQNNYKEKI